LPLAAPYNDWEMRSLFLLAMAAGTAWSQAVLTVGPGARFASVQAAVNAATPHTVIHILPGIYKERVVVPRSKPFLMFRGDDSRNTVITSDSHAGLPGPKGPINTFATQTVFIQANDFTAEKITFENSAGNRGQAVALTIMGDRGVFRDCRFLGYQDTLLPQAGRQYFERCYIEGAVDFIFGGSVAWFEECEIHVAATGYITAANTTADQRYGYVFHRAKITGAAGAKTFLGRPWRPWAHTVYLETEMSGTVRAEGWNNWGEPIREKTVRYAEYRSTGPGGAAGQRVQWARQLSDSEASEYTLDRVLGGLDGWNPRTATVRRAIAVTPAKVAAKPALKQGMQWIGAMPDGRMAWTSGMGWKIAKSAKLPAAGARLMRASDGVYHAVWTVHEVAPPSEADAAIRSAAANGPVGDSPRAPGQAPSSAVPSGWKLAHATSRDLESWSTPELTDPMAGKGALDLESPNLFEDGGRFLVTFSCTMAKNFIQAFQEDVERNPRIWYTATRDFQTFSESQRLFDNNYSARDGQILRVGSRFALLHLDSTGPIAGVRLAYGDAAVGPWGPSTDAFTPRGTAMPAAIPAGKEWWVFNSVGALRTEDFWIFEEVAMPEGIRILSVVEAPRRSPTLR
jgi:pectin methylesterase-like acyl-CoA thioesterase